MSKFNDFTTLNPLYKEVYSKSVRNSRRKILQSLKEGKSIRKQLKNFNKLKQNRRFKKLPT